MKKFLGSFKTVFLGCFVGFNLLFASGCNGSNQIVYGNYENYMSPELKKQVSHDYNVMFDYYGTDANLAADLKNNVFDIATASTNTLKELQKKGFISKIKWDQFKDKNNKPIFTDANGSAITSADEIAKKLFTEPVQKILGEGENNLLNWGIPYFLQSFVFVYWGNNNFKISEDLKNLTWEYVLNWIKDNYSYFNNGNLTSIEEKRTLFSLANIIYSKNVSVNPENQNDRSFDNLSKDYNEIFSSFLEILNKQTMHSNGNVVFLNSDSYVSVNKIATHEANGSFMFNGDALYAAEGGEFCEENPPIPGADFFIAVPNVTPLALDMIVINQNSSEKKQNSIYNTIYKIALDGWNATINGNSLNNDNYSSAIKDYGAIENFENVKYVSPLISINNYIDQWDSSGKNYIGYFKKVVSDHPIWKEKEPFEQKTISQALLNIYKATPPLPDGDATNFVEAPLSDEGKAALEFSFIQFKNSL